MSSMRWPYSAQRWCCPTRRGCGLPSTSSSHVCGGTRSGLPALAWSSVEVDRGEEVVEIQLAHAALQLEVDVQLSASPSMPATPGPSGRRNVRVSPPAPTCSSREYSPPRLTCNVQVRRAARGRRCPSPRSGLPAPSPCRRAAERAGTRRRRRARTAPTTLSRLLNAYSADTCQSPPQPSSGTRLRAMRSVLLAIAREARRRRWACRRRSRSRHRVDDRRVREAVQADQLQPARRRARTRSRHPSS